MKKTWPWFVLGASIVAAAYFVISGLVRSSVDEGPKFDDAEMPTEAEFDTTPPTGEELDLDSIDISFKDGENTGSVTRVSQVKRGTNVVKKVAASVSVPPAKKDK